MVLTECHLIEKFCKIKAASCNIYICMNLWQIGQVWSAKEVK